MTFKNFFAIMKVLLVMAAFVVKEADNNDKFFVSGDSRRSRKTARINFPRRVYSRKGYEGELL